MYFLSNLNYVNAYILGVISAGLLALINMSSVSASSSTLMRPVVSFLARERGLRSVFPLLILPALAYIPVPSEIKPL